MKHIGVIGGRTPWLRAPDDHGHGEIGDPGGNIVFAGQDMPRAEGITEARAVFATADPPRGGSAEPAAPEGPQRRARDVTDRGELPFLIRRDGTWLYRGSPIGRKSMVCLFASVLTRDEEGAFLLQTPAERGRIDVEDAPFVAVGLDWSGSGRDQVLTFRTNVDELVTAGPDHRIRIAHDLFTCEPTPYLHIRDGRGVFPVEARIGRAVYYELVALAEPGFRHGKRVLGIWSEGMFFSLGEIPGRES